MENDIKEVRYLSVKEVSAILKVDPQTIKRWIRMGKLKAFKAGSIGSSRYKILESDFKDYLSEKTVSVEQKQ